MSVLIAVPTFETIAPETFRAISKIISDDHTFDFVKGYDCAKCRNDIARKALDGGFDYVLMIDSDIVIPEDALANLMEYPADVCFGIYPRKSNRNETELFKTGSFNFTNRYLMDEIKGLNKNRIMVKGGGFGCALIKTDIFKKLKYPWFKYESYENNTFLSEDLYFCLMAEGKNIQADLRVRCGHIDRKILY